MSSRSAVRRALGVLGGVGDPAQSLRPLVLVGLSGGADSLALAAALAAEASGLGVRAGALIVDHGLQQGSDLVAERAAEQARVLGLDPVVVRRVSVATGGKPGNAGDGLEAAARSARYEAFAEVSRELGAAALVTAHTRDDQSEQVLLALARGSGTKSISGIPRERELAPGTRVIRPFLGEDPEITRAVTERTCAELGLDPWHDPHNRDAVFARVRVRTQVLPLLEESLGGGVTRGLARSADLAREDAEALDEWARTACDEVLGLNLGARDPLSKDSGPEPGVTVIHVPAAGVAHLAALPAAVRQRVIHRVAQVGFCESLTREHTLAIAALVTNWRGQGPVFAPGLRVSRVQGELHFERQIGSPRI